MKASTHTKTYALAIEMLNDWEAIFRVLEFPHLPLTNNEKEAQMLPLSFDRIMCWAESARFIRKA